MFDVAIVVAVLFRWSGNVVKKRFMFSYGGEQLYMPLGQLSNRAETLGIPEIPKTCPPLR